MKQASEKKEKKPIGDISTKFKDFEELKAEYELTDENITTKSVIRRMLEQIEFYLKTVLQILQPEEYHSLHECAFFDDADKEKLNDLYKRLIILHRELLKKEIQNEERSNIEIINAAHKELKSLKPDMINAITKMQDSWKETKHYGQQRYFG